MDIAGTKQKLQRMMKIAEESYKKMNQMMEKIQRLQEDMTETSAQVDRMEYDMAEQRALLYALAEKEGLDIEAILEAADLPDPEEDGSEDDAENETSDLGKKATSRPSANEE